MLQGAHLLGQHPRQGCMIVAISLDYDNYTDIKRDLSFASSTMTIRRRLKESWARCQVALQKPLFLMGTRHQFGREHLNWGTEEWANVLFLTRTHSVPG